MLPVVAIVGRPNVGKSALFNRLVGKRYAIESNKAGTTRDRLYHVVKFKDFEVMLVDTAGLDFDDDDNFENDVQAQAKLAVSEADVIFLIVDITQPLTADDYETADLLRKRGKRVILLANKADNQLRQDQILQYFELGFKHVIAVSAFHGHGLDGLAHIVSQILVEAGFSPEELKAEEDGLKIAFIGKPNVGKSSLVNKILGEYRMLVSDVPGTTRDAVDTLFEFENTKFVLIDTAGIRRMGKISPGIEKYSLFRSLQALQRADVALLIIDASEGVTRQDMRVSNFILEEACGLILVINKSDLFIDKNAAKTAFLSMLKRKFPYLPWAPVVFVSAITGQHVGEFLKLSKAIFVERNKKIPTPELNRFVKRAMMKHGAAGVGGRAMKIYYAAQVAVNPPEFVFSVNNPDAFHPSYRRFLERCLREDYGFNGTVIKFNFKSHREKSVKKLEEIV